VAALLLGSLASLRRWPWAGFLGVAFFAVLAPSSSIVPVLTQAMAEHRFYLPLAAVVTVVVIGGHALGERLLNWLGSLAKPAKTSWAIPGILVVSAAATLGYLTWVRNADYRSGLAIWQDTVEKKPDSPRAHNSLGMTLDGVGRHAEAMAHYREILRLEPDLAEAAAAHNNLGNSLNAQGSYAEAIDHFNEALRLKPDSPEAHNGLGNSLKRVGKPEESMAHYREALRLKPDYSAAHVNLANSLISLGRHAEAIAHMNEALRANPQGGQLYNNRAVSYFFQGDYERAWDDVRRAQKLGYQPNPQFLQQLRLKRESGQGYRRVP
jgi:tetratricopeptide (TPR) repeat protein